MKRKKKAKLADGRKPICLRVKPETASALAELALESNSSQGRVVDSFLKPFLKVN